jgi:predicted AlkP superfamily pyrophosphatase or phosphodiesterase
MRKIVTAALGLLAACSPSATVAQPLRPDAPKLIVAISVDQLSSDLWDEYRPHFRGGLGRLAGGTVFANGYQGHAATETCPGHSTVLTGTRPATNGIVANVWVDQSAGRTDKTLYCAEDERVPGSTSTAYTVSPFHLRVPTLGDLLKRVSPASRNVAVAGKDRSAVMMGGRAVDQRWFYKSGTFASDLTSAAPPRSTASTNAALAAALAQPRPDLVAPPVCEAKSRAYALSPALTVGNGRLARAVGDSRGFTASPEFDGVTLALAAALFQEMQLGRGQATDILSIGLAATDYVGHGFGTGGAEMCLQLHALDRELGDFFALLDRSGVDYAVVMTADHGGMDIPERLREQGVAGAARADPALATSEAGKLIGGRMGLAGPVLLGPGTAGDIWLSRSLSAADRQRVLSATLAHFRAHPQVEGAFAADDIAAVPMPGGSPAGWSVKQRLRASFDRQRSGDLLVVLKQNISPIAAPSRGYAATHGSPWDYDRRVPVVFWRKGMAAANRSDAVETVDIMPTLAAMIGLAVPAVDGRCLNVPGAACPPAAVGSASERGRR